MSSISKTKHNTNCCVFGCHSRKGADRNIHFHYFPRRNSGVKVKILNASGIGEVLDRRKAWEKVLLMGKPVSDSMRVCSKHFKPDDYCAKGVKLAKPKLTIYAVPSLNLPDDLLKTQQLCLAEMKKQQNSDLCEERLDMRQELKDHQYSRVNDEELLSSLRSPQKSYKCLTKGEKMAVENSLCLDQQPASEEITLELNMDSTDSEDEQFLIKINNIENVIGKGEPSEEAASEPAVNFGEHFTENHSKEHCSMIMADGFQENIVQEDSPSPVLSANLLRHHIRYFTAKDMMDPIQAKRFRELAIRMLANKDQTITALQRKVRKLEKQLVLEKIKQTASSLAIDFL